MPEMTLNIPIPDIAGMINNMNKQEIETLYMFLTKQGSDRKRRLKPVKDREWKIKDKNKDIYVRFFKKIVGYAC